MGPEFYRPASTWPRLTKSTCFVMRVCSHADVRDNRNLPCVSSIGPCMHRRAR